MSGEGGTPSAGRHSDAPAIARASSDPDHHERHVEQPGPAEMRDPLIRHELKRASVWFGLALAIAAVIFLAQPLLLIFAGIVLASMLDGGTRLLGRVLPIGRGWRLAIVTIAVVAFIVWVFYFAGTELTGQAERLREAITAQGTPLYADARLYGEHGIPAVLYGAGPRTVPESNAKKADERLALDDLKKATKVVALTLLDFLAE